jgi:hypothetical protein
MRKINIVNLMTRNVLIEFKLTTILIELLFFYHANPIILHPSACFC